MINMVESDYTFFGHIRSPKLRAIRLGTTVQSTTLRVSAKTILVGPYRKKRQTVHQHS